MKKTNKQTKTNKKHTKPRPTNRTNKTVGWEYSYGSKGRRTRRRKGRWLGILELFRQVLSSVEFEYKYCSDMCWDWILILFIAVELECLCYCSERFWFRTHVLSRKVLSLNTNVVQTAVKFEYLGYAVQKAVEFDYMYCSEKGADLENLPCSQRCSNWMLNVCHTSSKTWESRTSWAFCERFVVGVLWTIHRGCFVNDTSWVFCERFIVGVLCTNLFRASWVQRRPMVLMNDLTFPVGRGSKETRDI